MRATASLLFVFALSLSASAEDPRRLAPRLADPDFAVRESAAQKLLSLGLSALPALEETRRSNSPEAIRRANNLIARIQFAEESRRAVAVPAFSVDFRDKPLAEALVELRRITRIPLVLDEKSQTESQHRVTLKTGSVPPWEAVEAFRAAANLVEVFPEEVPSDHQTFTMHPSGQIIRTAKTARPSDQPIVFRLGEAAPRPAMREHGLRVLVANATPYNPRTKLLSLSLGVMPTPSLNWARTDEIRIGRVVEANGQRLEPIYEFSHEYERPDSILVQKGRGQLQQQVELPPIRAGSGRLFRVILSCEKPVQELQSLHGIVSGVIHREKEPLLVIDDLNDAVGKTFPGAHGSTLTVVQFAQDRLTLSCSSFSPWVLRQRGLAREGEIGETGFNRTLPSRIRWMNSSGKTLSVERTIVTVGHTPNGVTESCTVTFAFPSPAVGPSGTPAKLVVLGTKLVPVEVPFTLERIPLK